ncbi:MAG: hypothetical protein ACJ8FY_00300 [Gemmataceae bacterium]
MPATQQQKGESEPISGRWPALELTFVALVSLLPFLIERSPVELVTPYATAWGRYLSKAVVVVGMACLIALRGRFDRSENSPSYRLASLMIGASGLMTACHVLMVDQFHWVWQQQLYLDILNHQGEIPHRYRFLPYGFTRTLERLTGDWWFACLAYRWFFSYWFLEAAYRFARLYLPERRAQWTLVPLACLYPFSILYYWGQLTDPMSHALFVLALLYTVQNRWLLLAFVSALGMLAKETALLAVVSYFACYVPQGKKGIGRTAILAAVCITVYFAARLPLGWELDFGKFNNTSGLMIRHNLLGSDLYSMAAPLAMNYVLPLVFVGSFVPFLIRNWKSTDWKLRVIFLTLVPLLLLSNLCFGWLYEARNYMPLVPLLATMAFQGPIQKPQEKK